MAQKLETVMWCGNYGEAIVSKYIFLNVLQYVVEKSHRKDNYNPQ